MWDPGGHTEITSQSLLHLLQPVCTDCTSRLTLDPNQVDFRSVKDVNYAQLDLLCEQLCKCEADVDFKTPIINLVCTGDEDYFLNSRTQTYLRTLHETVPRSARRSRVCRSAKFSSELHQAQIDRVTLDTGASSANYIGKSAVNRFPDVEIRPCRHNVRLGDGETNLTLDGYVILTVTPMNDYGEELEPVTAEFYIMEKLGDEAIIGLPDILGSFYDYFLSVLGSGPSKKPVKVLGNIVSDIQDICDDFEDELYKRAPRIKVLHRLAKTARNKLSRYTAVKSKVLNDPEATSTFVINSVNLNNDEYRVSKHYCLCRQSS